MATHGALLDVNGVGVLLLGPSGVGKSECALELVSRGHRLVADDLVDFRDGEDGRLLGSAPERIRHYMEIRGLGIVFIPDLFGPDSVSTEVPVDLVCRIQAWQKGDDVERVGLDRPIEEVRGRKLPCLNLPARPGGSMATIVEVAVRDHQQRCSGVNAARRLDERVRGEMQRS
jgi:HPr kinase/phosphorylase